MNLSQPSRAVPRAAQTSHYATDPAVKIGDTHQFRSPHPPIAPALVDLGVRLGRAISGLAGHACYKAGR